MSSSYRRAPASTRSWRRPAAAARSLSSKQQVHTTRRNSVRRLLRTKVHRRQCTLVRSPRCKPVHSQRRTPAHMRRRTLAPSAARSRPSGAGANDRTIPIAAPRRRSARPRPARTPRWASRTSALRVHVGGALANARQVAATTAAARADKWVMFALSKKGIEEVIPLLQVYSPAPAVGNDYLSPPCDLVVISSWGDFATWEKVRGRRRRRPPRGAQTASPAEADASSWTSVAHAYGSAIGVPRGPARVAKTQPRRHRGRCIQTASPAQGRTCADAIATSRVMPGEFSRTREFGASG